MPGPVRLGGRLWLAYAAFGVAATLLYLFVPPFAGNGPFFNILGLSTAVAMVAGWRLHRPAIRAPWLLFAAGQLLFVTGDVFYYTYPKLAHREVPFPSPADGFYLGVYPLVILGLLLLIRSRNPGRDRASLIDGLIVSVGVGVLAWIYLMAPYAGDGELSLANKAFSMAYPLMDLILLAVVVRLAVDSGHRQGVFYLLVGGVVSLMVADAAYGYITVHGTYETGSFLDVGWLIYYFAWGVAALHPSTRSLSETGPQERPRFSRRRLALLAGASLIAPAVGFTQALRDGHGDPLVITGASVILFLLVVARMNGLIRKHEESEGRERALREAGAELVLTGSREGIALAAARAVERLAEGARTVRLWLPVADAPPPRAGGRGGIRDLSGLPEDVRPALERGEPVNLRPEPRLRESLDLAPEDGAALLVPLLTKGALGGAFVLGSAKPLPRTVEDSVTALASQTALALEAARLAEEAHRRRSEARFRSLVQHSSDVITVIGADAVVLYQSPAAERVLGYAADALTGTSLLDHLHPEDLPRVVTMLGEGGLKAGRSETLEFRWGHPDGRWIHTETLWTDLSADPNVGGILLNSRDVSERKAFEKQLAHQAFHDPVTNLANRALFRDRIEHALALQDRGARALSILFIDLDDFKTVNDSLGHASGDQLLAEVARRLCGSLRAVDTAARLGGDEFGVLLEDTDTVQATQVAERIMASLIEPFVLEGTAVVVQASAGIAVSDPDGVGSNTTEALLRDADAAMYMAKSLGKGRCEVFEPAMHATVLRRLELKADLQRATSNGEFTLFYQPIVELATGRVSGLEALVRWIRPDGEMVPPGEFIPLAEETGLILPIGRWVLGEACRQARRLQRAHPSDRPLTMSVNVSARQLQHAGFVDDVAQALAETRLDPSTLTLEITESVMMEDTDLAIARLHQLKGLGVGLAIDDFGTGYSSLNSLRSFPIDVLKVDKSFIDGVARTREDSAVVAAIIELAGVLQLHTVAEGIEHVEQLEKLVALHCALGQGYHLSRPLDAVAVERFLAERAPRPSSARSAP